MNFQNDSAVKTKSAPAIPTDERETGADGTPQSESGSDENWLKRFEDARAKLAKLRGSKKAQLDLGWLARDPSEWMGRKIRHRLNGKIFMIRNVLTNGQVELEKSWMTYLSYVWIIRAEFEPCC